MRCPGDHEQKERSPRLCRGTELHLCARGHCQGTDSCYIKFPNAVLSDGGLRTLTDNSGPIPLTAKGCMNTRCSAQCQPQSTSAALASLEPGS